MSTTAETVNDFKGLPVNIRTDRIDLLGTLPVAEHEAVNSAAADVVPTMLNCREIGVDTTGIIKFDYKDHFGAEHTEVRVLAAGVPVKFRNVCKVYRYYVGTTACSSEVYTDAGASVVGLKLYR